MTHDMSSLVLVIKFPLGGFAPALFGLITSKMKFCEIVVRAHRASRKLVTSSLEIVLG